MLVARPVQTSAWWSHPITWVQQHVRGVALAMWLTALLVHILNGLLLIGYASKASDFLGVIMQLGFFTLLTFGALIVIRRPGNVMGWIFCGIGFLDALQSLAIGYEIFAGARSFPLVNWVAWAGTAPDLTTLLVLLIVVPYLFPTGRVLSRRWRPLLWLSIAVIISGVIHGAFAVREVGVDATQEDANPVRIAAVAAVLSVVEQLGIVVLPLVLLGAVASMTVRYRRARGVERLQIRWLLWMLGLIVTGIFFLFIAEFIAPTVVNMDDDWTLPEIVLGVSILVGITCGIPAVLGLAILRYRLYSIDLIVNRTLVYGALTLGLGAIYWGSVVLIQQLLDPLTPSSDLAVAASTLAVAALFQPLRRRIQRTVDRRFFRRKYDAARTIEAFNAQLRDAVDLQTLAFDLRTVVLETMEPASVTLWLRSPGSATRADAASQRDS